MANYGSGDCQGVTGKLKGAVFEAEINSHQLLQSQSANQHPEDRRQELPQSPGRQTSIYSLTLNQFQTSLSQSDKNFGSMNMDEFLNSIMMAEENQSQGIPPTPLMSTPSPFPMQQISAPINQVEVMILNRQPSLPRQGSLNIPEPLSSKTVEEVWAELQNDDGDDNIHELLKNRNASQKQSTFGDMTLEDFLDRAGVMREQQGYGYMLQPPQQHPLGFNPNYVHLNSGPNFARTPLMEMGGWVNIAAANHGLQGGSTENVGGNQQMPPRNGGGYMVLPASPGPSDRMGKNKVDGGKSKRRGRKRIHNASVEKVVVRKQKRMLMNRESAARSRERKQAYTLVLEEELSILRGDNKRLREALAESEREKQLKMQHDEEEAARANANMGTTSDKVNEKSNMQYHEDETMGANTNMGTKSPTKSMRI